jgi:hypothetical protein
MIRLRDVVWPAVFAVGLAAASVLTALLADSTSVSTALGLAAVVSALLAQRA